MRTILLTLGIILSFPVLAIDQNIEAKVLLVGSYGDGSLFVDIDATIPEPNCSRARFDANIAEGVPLEIIKVWLSIAMTAQATGQTVVIRTNGCTSGGFPRLLGDQTTWLFLKQ